MKVALCMYGIVGGVKDKNGTGGNIDCSIGYNLYKKHIIDKNDVDIFIHSWSIEEEEKILSLYNPKTYIIEKQKIFKHQKWSRWYSNKKVIELKKEYEIKNKFTYDWVMVSRFDVAFFTDLIFNNYDNRYFYASHWNDVGNRKNYQHGFLDFWFFSNSEYMNNFSKTYDCITNYHENAHICAKQHTLTFTDKIKYVFYRWEDHEMIRRKLLKANR